MLYERVTRRDFVFSRRPDYIPPDITTIHHRMLNMNLSEDGAMQILEKTNPCKICGYRPFVIGLCQDKNYRIECLMCSKEAEWRETYPRPTIEEMIEAWNVANQKEVYEEDLYDFDADGDLEDDN